MNHIGARWNFSYCYRFHESTINFSPSLYLMEYRFPTPSHASSSSKNHCMAILHELERQATHEWRQTSSVLPSGSAKEGEALRAVAAYDFMTVQIPTSPESRVLQVDALYEASGAAIGGANLSEREQTRSKNSRGERGGDGNAGRSTKKRRED